MKEISLKRPAEKTSKVGAMPEMSKESYPSFSIYDKAPEELMKCNMGCEMMAKIKLTSKDMHEGPGARQSVGFDVMSVMMDDKNEKIDGARAKGKAIGDRIKKEGVK